MEDYHKINYAFEKAVIQLQDNLQYTANKGKVSKEFLNRQNWVIKSLIEFQKYTAEYIEFLQKDNATVHIERRETIKFYKNRITAFEAICIIHGVTDFPYWILQGKTNLFEKAVHLNKSDEMQLPCMLDEKIKRLSTHEKKIVEDILYREQREKTKKMLIELNEMRKSILSKFNKADKTTMQQLAPILKLMKIKKNGFRI